MRLPATPPDECQQPGYITPPNALNSLTPDSTPRRMTQSRSNVLSHTKSSRTKTSGTVGEGPATPAPNNHDRRYDSTGKSSAAGDDVDIFFKYIPVEEMNMTTDMQGSDGLTTPELSPTSQLQHLRIRKKHKQVSSGDPSARDVTEMVSNEPAKTATWNDLPPDMVMNDRLYQQIRRRKMDRIEAIEDGTAIEAVIMPAEAAARVPSLRHVKKRQSLRLGSADMSHEGQKQAQHIQEEKSALESRQISSLRHKKAFIASGHGFDSTLANSTSCATGAIARTLRHERRALSAEGRPRTSDSTLSFSFNMADARRHVSLPLHPIGAMANDTQHGLRRLSKDSRVENKRVSVDGTESIKSAPNDTSTMAYPGLSPSIKSHRFTNTQTPMSGISDRTEMEVCEAKNVTLFTHSNDSVLLIEHAARKTQLAPSQLTPRVYRPLSFTFEDPESMSSTSSSSLSRSLSTPEIQINSNVHSVDSPLTNPRAAPLPPTIQFIPPTPSIDDDRQNRPPGESLDPVRPELQRSGSLMRTARRLSDTILTPLFPRTYPDKDVSRARHVSPAGNDRLHPMWTPSAMWHDDDNDDDDYSTDDEDYDERDRLPAGGDTSEHPAQHPRSFFPRKMSVRMPGFRGTGGFLQGNTLGVERHGTNSRRHHVTRPAKQQARHNTFLQLLKRRVKGMRTAREDAAREKRRAALKDSIGLRVVHIQL